MINKRWITLPVVYSRPFASKAVFWAILNEFEFAFETVKGEYIQTDCVGLLWIKRIDKISSQRKNSSIIVKLLKKLMNEEPDRDHWCFARD